ERERGREGERCKKGGLLTISERGASSLTNEKWYADREARERDKDAVVAVVVVADGVKLSLRCVAGVVVVARDIWCCWCCCDKRELLAVKVMREAVVASVV